MGFSVTVGPATRAAYWPKPLSVKEANHMSNAAMSPHRPARREGPRLGIGPGLVATGRGLVFFGLMVAGLALVLLGLLAPFWVIGYSIWLFVWNGALHVQWPTAGFGYTSVSASPSPSPFPTLGGRISALPSVHSLGRSYLAPGQQWPRDFIPLGLIAAALIIGWFLLPTLLLTLRSLLNQTRRLSSRWCGVPIAAPYRRPGPDTNLAGTRHRIGWLLADPATWRDLLWVVVNAALGFLLIVVPAAVAGAVLGRSGRAAVGQTPAQPAGHLAIVLATLGAAAAVGCVLAGPWLLRGYGWLAHSMLAPAGQAGLTARMEHLTQTRSETLDTGAAEIRRIERDLHDGAQARLVAMGMTLSAAEQLVDTSPDAARALLAEARDSSAKALAELRSLVRGIHPPVLADRGLAEAIKALALDSPVRIHIASELSGRPAAPVESAAFFAVSELLTNVAKHACARQAWIDIRYSGGMLRIGVTDDGAGGADPVGGSGLRGIERRLAAFDGVLAISSPPGGPTTATMEIPCALSSPKISFC
jgi:signal transduction histidine kinase